MRISRQQKHEFESHQEQDVITTYILGNHSRGLLVFVSFNNAWNCGGEKWQSLSCNS